MKYIIEVSTNWIGEDNIYKTECNPEEIEDYAQSLAQDNFDSYGGFDSVAEDLGYNLENLTEEQIDEINEYEHEYYDFYYEEFKGTDKEFNELEYDLV